MLLSEEKGWRTVEMLLSRKRTAWRCYCQGKGLHGDATVRGKGLEIFLSDEKSWRSFYQRKMAGEASIRGKELEKLLSEAKEWISFCQRKRTREFLQEEKDWRTVDMLLSEGEGLEMLMSERRTGE
jgi:hypothetical protein